ncbi:hypothetical protein LQ327_00645 [Actinomycetospora endophytica]|uniref:Uncharacterized protein n=1 Tax=Actinomycetospora endophytica TaxID=2291215 RepID=A0ABS8P0X7_9PSEU|nr:hypothetical protein [Actinomycetospora endophytica]MCD2191897.1 hypothetical protein [Actinomycetospora endophytica]
MDEKVLVSTRRALHGVAELVLAGPQQRAHGTIHLQAVPGGFRATAAPVRVEGVELVWDSGRIGLEGRSCAELASAVDATAAAPGTYPDASGVAPEEPLAVDPIAADLLESCLARGDEGLRRFAAGCEPVLWPEHFDVGIDLDEVNYGLSPGDAQYPRPYAYVGPWSPRDGTFWNVSFGALRWADDLPDADAVAAFFEEGRRRT